MLTRLLTLGLALTLLGGCGKIEQAKDRAKLSNDMKQLGISYLNYQDSEGRPPKSQEELDKKQKLAAGIGNVTVIWGPGMGPMCKDGAAAEIAVAHANAPGGSGVLVLFATEKSNLTKQNSIRRASRNL